MGNSNCCGHSEQRLHELKIEQAVEIDKCYFEGLKGIVSKQVKDKVYRENILEALDTHHHKLYFRGRQPELTFNTNSVFRTWFQLSTGAWY